MGWDSEIPRSSGFMISRVGSCIQQFVWISFPAQVPGITKQAPQLTRLLFGELIKPTCAPNSLVRWVTGLSLQMDRAGGQGLCCSVAGPFPRSSDQTSWLSGVRSYPEQSVRLWISSLPRWSDRTSCKIGSVLWGLDSNRTVPQFPAEQCHWLYSEDEQVCLLTLHLRIAGLCSFEAFWAGFLLVRARSCTEQWLGLWFSSPDQGESGGGRQTWLQV